MKNDEKKRSVRMTRAIGNNVTFFGTSDKKFFFSNDVAVSYGVNSLVGSVKSVVISTYNKRFHWDYIRASMNSQTPVAYYISDPEIKFNLDKIYEKPPYLTADQMKKIGGLPSPGYFFYYVRGPGLTNITYAGVYTIADIENLFNITYQNWYYKDLFTFTN